jgi:hypothetical protein
MGSLLKTSALVSILGGCVASAGVGVQATTPPPAVYVEPAPPPPPPPQPEPVVEVAYVEPTAFVYVSPQVQVIEDYDYPVFFSDGMYWRVEGGVWYSSSYHDRGWYVNQNPPVYVRTIDRPTQYVHYRANPQARPGQIGFRAAVTTPIHHSAPPPRFVEQPGHPHPVQTAQPVGGRPEPGMHPEHPEHPERPEHPEHPEHPMGPPGHVEGGVPPGHMEPPPGQAHEPPGHMHEPPGHAEGMHENHAPPPPPAGHAAPPPPPPAAHAPPPAPPPAAHAPPPGKHDDKHERK